MASPSNMRYCAGPAGGAGGEPPQLSVMLSGPKLKVFWLRVPPILALSVIPPVEALYDTVFAPAEQEAARVRATMLSDPLLRETFVMVPVLIDQPNVPAG